MPKNYKYAVFLDHDIFPVKPISFLKSLEKQKNIWCFADSY